MVRVTEALVTVIPFHKQVLGLPVMSIYIFSIIYTSSYKDHELSFCE